MHLLSLIIQCCQVAVATAKKLKKGRKLVAVKVAVSSNKEGAVI
jgi:hypothetical protein